MTTLTMFRTVQLALALSPLLATAAGAQRAVDLLDELQAHLAARRSEPVRAARLLGIVAGLGVPLEEPEAEEAVQLRASLVTELGAARFAQEERFGQTLPADEAMALALGD
jgi:hypothetical protein